MKAVNGYLTEDDTFFDKQEEAELYEAELALREACDKPNLDDDKLIDALVHLRPHIERYFHALTAVDKSATDEQEPSETAPPPLELTPRGDEPVPYVGRRSHSKRVRN